MPSRIKPIPFKPHRLLGFSDRLIASHYEKNYGGAVQRLNLIDARLSQFDWSSAPGFMINGLQREKLIAANSMILHEVYFDGLGGADGLGSPAVDPSGSLAHAIERDFGSYEKWRSEFTAMGRAMSGGSGWVILGWCPREGRLVNDWAADHTHTRAGSIPLLALDMYEHAYQMDFGADAKAYVDTFMKNIHWDRPALRFEAGACAAERVVEPADTSAPMSAEELSARLAAGEQPLLLDICLAVDLPKRHDTLPGATFLPAEKRAEWIEQLPRDRPIIAYCMYGFQVSGDVVAELQKRGLKARNLAGGIASWRAIGGATEPLKQA